MEIKVDSTGHGKKRSQRIRLAWTTSLVSKLANAGLQLIAVPVVYRALGASGYAAFAAVTASAGLIVFLNLGIGGSLVTPLAEAVACGDEKRQTLLIQAGLRPLVLGCFAGAACLLPLVAFLPLTTLFGRTGVAAAAGLRQAALIAAAATLLTIPLSCVTFLRQAYQEIHVTNLIGAVSNGLLCLLFLVAAARASGIAVYVGLFLIIPLCAFAANLGVMFARRPYLLQRVEGFNAESRHLLGDGIRFLGVAVSNGLIYQWPVYWVARSLPASESSSFAICIQAILLPLSFVVGILQPLWPATADAIARGDINWVKKHIQIGRRWTVAGGASAFLVLSLAGDRLMHLWLRQPFVLDWRVRTLMGTYMFLTFWEQFHFFLVMGKGCLRQGAAAVFQRCLGFALAVPLLAKYGGPAALWAGLCCSILLSTAWRLPRLLHLPVQQTAGGLGNFRVK
jgi:O-antigen/teichoic acid export membrane protein